MYTFFNLIGPSALINIWENAPRSFLLLVNGEMTQNHQLFYSAMLINIKGNSGKPKREGETQEIEVRVRGDGKGMRGKQALHALPLIDYSQLKNDQLHRWVAIWRRRFK